MGMTKCKECGSTVSTKAVACPQCGGKQPKRTSLVAWVGAGALAVVVGSCVANIATEQKATDERQAARAASEASKTPAQREQEAAAAKKKEDDFQFALAATRSVRAAMKDPKSFEMLSAGVVDDGALCLTYRGRNSLGAMKVEQVAVGRSLKTVAWNKACGGKSGTDVSHLKTAL